MTEKNAGGGFAAVLEDLAGSRGYTLDGLAEETRRRGYDYTPDEIITGGRGGFGDAVNDVLGLDEGERLRVVRALTDDWSERVGARRVGEVPPPDAPPLPKAPGLGRYPGESDERCCVSHPDAGGPCGEPATQEVWALPFCERHGEEAEYAAVAEMYEDARRAVEAALEAARGRWRKNAALLYLLRQAIDEAYRSEWAHASDHEHAVERAGYPSGDPGPGLWRRP